MEVSSSSVTTIASIPEITPKVIDTWRPKLTSSRKFVVQDDPNTSDFTGPLTGIPKGKALQGIQFSLNGNLIPNISEERRDSGLPRGEPEQSCCSYCRLHWPRPLPFAVVITECIP